VSLSPQFADLRFLAQEPSFVGEGDQVKSASKFQFVEHIANLGFDMKLPVDWRFPGCNPLHEALSAGSR
jgi:NADH:ubiquinone oxidoreductase subunit B-like Fe-S oxidoreductase